MKVQDSVSPNDLAEEVNALTPWRAFRSRGWLNASLYHTGGCKPLVVHCSGLTREWKRVH